MTGEGYYNYYNLQEYLSKKNLYSNDIRYLKDIVNTKVSMFYYDGLPKPLTSEIIETALLFNHQLCFWWNKGTEELTLCRYVPNSVFNEYWKPLNVNLLGLNGKQLAYNVPYEDIILCRDNTMDIVPYLTIDEYIRKINQIEKTLFINIDLLRLPAIFDCDKKQSATIKQYIKKLYDFEPFAIGDKNTLGEFKQYPIQLPVPPSEIYDLKEKYKRECLISLGIYSSDIKKERLISGEVDAQNDYVDIIYQGCLKERERYINEINKKYGYNIKVKQLYVEDKKQDIDLKVKEAKEIEEVTNNESSKNV